MTTSTECFVEIHLNSSPDFTRKGYGKKVKAVGGKFAECRGYSSIRFVHIPMLGNTELIDEVIHKFGQPKHTPVIFRSSLFKNYPTWVVVQYAKKDLDEPILYAIGDFNRSYLSASKRGLIPASK